MNRQYEKYRSSFIKAQKSEFAKQDQRKRIAAKNMLI